ncbi:uncharacterized protein LOC118272827 isoform X2 [Spodoptera frugiperda]|nr:uncharacterized protein LOC118272827 isoform X2 [Spodoptera frugiperda]
MVSLKTTIIKLQMELVTKLKELRVAVGRGKIDEVKNIVKWFEQDVDRIRTLSKAYENTRACPTQDDLVIAACSHNQKHVLDYLLSQTDILYYLTDSTQNITEVIEKRTEAVRHALRLEDFEMVVKLYDYWIGDLYWKGHRKDNFEMLGKILNGANNYKNGDKNFLGWVCSIFKKILIRCRFMTINQQLIIDFESIIKVNDFQQKLYNTLPKPLSHYAVAEDTAAEGTNGKDTVETARVILNLLNIYDEYSVIDKVRIKDVTKEKQIKSYFEDTDSIYFRALADIKYEFYFRKVDFNMALLLLEKLYIIRNYLKKHFNTNQLQTASKTYREIEYAIYHLIYRTSEDWRLYLPADRQLTEETHHIGIYNGAMGRLKTTYDIHKLYNSPVLYLEREHYKTCLRNLKDILNEYCIKPDPVIDGEQNNTNTEKLLDENYLKPKMKVSDHYSLNKIITYIEALEQTTDTDIITIERVLQVIGEMVKAEGTGGESSHLSKETKTYLQIAISADTIKHLKGIRDFLSHAHKGQLSIRIDIENNQADMLLNVKEELVEIKEKIVPIRDLCKLVLDNSLLQHGLDLLDKRIKALPARARQRIDEIKSGFEKHAKNFVSESGEYYRKVWKPAKMSHQLLVEIPMLLKNKDEILSKKEEINKEINNKTMNILSAYKHNAIQTLERMKTNNDCVDKVNPTLEFHKINPLKCSPTLNDINITKDRLKSKKISINEIESLTDNLQLWQSVVEFANLVRKYQKGDGDKGTNNTSAEATAAKDTAEEKTKAEYTAAEHTVTEYTTAEDTAVEDTAVEKTTAEYTTAEDTAVEKTVAEYTTAEDTAVEKTVAEYTTAEDTAVEDTAAGKTAAEDTAVEKTVAEYTTAEDTAVEKTVAEYTTAEDTAVEKIFAEYTTAENTAVEDTAAGRTTGEDTAAEKTTAEDTATEDIAAEGTAAEDTAAEDTAAEDTAAEDTAAEDTATEDTAAEDIAAEDTAAEDTRLWQSGNGDTAAEDTTAHWKSVVDLAKLVTRLWQSVVDFAKLVTRFSQSGNGDTAAEDTTAHWKSVVDLAELVNQEPSTYPPSTDKINFILNKVQGVCPGNNQSTNNTFTGIKNLNEEVEKKSKTYIEVKEYTKRHELTTCLINRIKRLRATLRYPEQIPLRELVQLYKLDPKFRFELEMLLADIENVMNITKQNSRKSRGLLEYIVLGNVLDHGNAFLEVIGDLIDSQELPRELLSKAISYADDQEAVEALEALFQHNVDFDTINDGTLANMNDAQKGY